MIPSISFSLTFKDGKQVENNDLDKYIDNTIKIPKYFFANTLNKKSCSLKGVHGDGSWGEKYSEMELTLLNEKNYAYMMKFSNYDWQKVHGERSNSLNVDHSEHTSRLALLHGTIINSIISETISEESKKITEIMTAWADAGVFLNTLTLDDTKKLKEQGKTPQLCYGGGKGDIHAECLPHRILEAHIYGASFMINAFLVKDYFSTQQFKIIDHYIDTLYTKYVFPWAYKHLQDKGSWDRAFTQMAEGSIAVLAYLAWKNKPEESYVWIKRAIDKANRVIYEDGYINNNSFRGVRDVWYHSQGVNNLIGLIAIADIWGYSNFPEETKQKIYKTVDILNLGLTDVKKYRERKDPNGLKNFSKDQMYAAYHVHQMAISIDWLIDNYTDRDSSVVKKDYMWKAKKSQFFVDRNFGFEPKCMN